MPKSATVAKIISFLAPLSLIIDFFITNNTWTNATWIIVLFSCFYLGTFFTFASSNSMIDFWGAESRLGRTLSDPENGKQAILTQRVIGVGFIVFMLFIAFSFIRYPISLTGRYR